MSEGTGDQIIGENWFQVLDVKHLSLTQNWQLPEQQKDTELKFAPEKQIAFDRIVVESRNDIGKYIPQALPDEATHFFILPGFGRREDNHVVDGGEYLGKYGKKHYISIRIPKDLVENGEAFTAEQEALIRLAIQHEFLHQAHAEKVGQMKFFMTDYSDMQADEDMSYEKVRSLKDKTPSNKGKGVSLFSAVTEGAATLGELYLVGKQIEEMKTAGDSTRASILERYKANRLKYLVNALRIYHLDAAMSSHMFGGPYAIGVIKIMHGLYKRFGLESITDLIGKIDLDRCRQIRAGSEEFDKICSDPSSLPGLEQK